MFTSLDDNLRRFLSERGLYFQFLRNLITNAQSFEDYASKRKKLSKCNPKAIDIAFDWYTSFEDEPFWSSVNRKWQIWYGVLLTAGLIEPYTEIDELEKTNLN